MTEGGSVVLTGVSRGIGAALGLCLLEQGWKVCGIGRSANPALLSFGEKFTFLYADLSKSSDVVAAALNVSGPVDFLINSAATFGGDAFYARDFDDGALQVAFNVNVVAPCLLARLLKPKLQTGEHRGIVMMSTGNASLSGNTAGEMFAYRITKSGLNQAMRSMAAEWGEDGFTVVALNPGWVKTDMGGDAAPLSASDAADDILRFLKNMTKGQNGKFLNTDGSSLPW